MVKAGGSSTTRPKRRSSRAKARSWSKALSETNVQDAARPFRSALCRAQARDVSERSIPSAEAAPPPTALTANPPE